MGTSHGIPDLHGLLPGRRSCGHDGGHANGNANADGYVLLEIIIALTIFAITVTGLATLLHSTLDSANLLRRQAAVRRGLESTLNEANARPKREEMTLSWRDEGLGIEFTSALEEVKWINRTGQPVKGLYLLTAEARNMKAGNEPRDKAELYVYRP